MIKNKYMKEDFTKYEQWGEYFFPYTNEVGAGCWDWTGSNVDKQRIYETGIYETEKEAIKESERLNEQRTTRKNKLYE